MIWNIRAPSKEDLEDLRLRVVKCLEWVYSKHQPMTTVTLTSTPGALRQLQDARLTSCASPRS